MSFTRRTDGILDPCVCPKALPVLTALAIVLSLALSPARLSAQAEAAKKADENPQDQKEPPVPDPEYPVLTTDDELSLKVSYFPGMDGQESIPVIVIHGLSPKSNRREFDQDDGLARFLQTTLHCAVIVPDLRGHGESTKWSDALQKKLREARKRPKDALKPEKLKPADQLAMLDEDLRAVKDFLWKQNNERKLNLDKLTVIGVEEGAALAISYAAADANGYEQHQAKRGPLKLGNFVKAVVLISPVTKRVTALNTARILHDAEYRDLRMNLPIMILAGDESPTYFKEAEALHNEFLKGRPKLDSKAAKPEDFTLWFYGKGQTGTKLQGAKLLAEPSLKGKTLERIQRFMKARLVDNPDAKEWAWKERKLPYE
jgi:pimeloyl-ACP methyl ester carboxylesterase